MSEEILINMIPKETKVAVVDNGVLQEMYIERTHKKGLLGNIFKGRVSRVLPVMQAAFIDIGLERTGFLHTLDIVTSYQQEDDVTKPIPLQLIETVIREGNEILVRVIKDPIGAKGTRLTTRLSKFRLAILSLSRTTLLLASSGVSKMRQNGKGCETLSSAINPALNDWQSPMEIIWSCIAEYGNQKY